MEFNTWPLSMRCQISPCLAFGTRAAAVTLPWVWRGFRLETLDQTGRLAYLDEVSVGVAQIAAQLGDAVDRLGEEVDSVSHGMCVKGGHIGYTHVEEAGCPVAVLGRFQCDQLIAWMRSDGQGRCARPAASSRRTSAAVSATRVEPFLQSPLPPPAPP